MRVILAVLATLSLATTAAAQQAELGAAALRQTYGLARENGLLVDFYWESRRSASGDWSRGYRFELQHVVADRPASRASRPVPKTTGAFGWRFNYAGLARAWSGKRSSSDRITLFADILLMIPVRNHFRLGAGYGVQVKLADGLAVRYQADGYFVGDDPPLAGRRAIAMVWVIDRRR